MGRRLHGDDWVGTEPKIFRLRVVASTDDMRKEIEPSQHTPDLPTEEVTLPLHFEANAQDHSQDEEQRAARQRCIGAETKLRQIMSTHPVKSWMRDSERGVDEPLTQAQWDPAYDSFWINVSSGFCGDSRKGQEGGPGLIDCADFDAAIEDEFGVARVAKEEGPANTQGITPQGYSDKWALPEQITSEQFVCLWWGTEPRGLKPEVRRLLLPGSEAIEKFLWEKMWAGKIVPAKVPALWKMLHETQGKPIGYHPDLIFGRDDLKKLAIESGNERPKFLFPEEEQPASPQSVGETAHKRTTLAIWKMIPIVEAEIGGPPSHNALVDHFQKEKISEESPRTFHDDFQDAYIEEKKILHWKDRDGNRQNTALTSLPGHRRTLRRRLSTKSAP